MSLMIKMQRKDSTPDCVVVMLCKQVVCSRKCYYHENHKVNHVMQEYS